MLAALHVVIITNYHCNLSLPLFKRYRSTTVPTVLNKKTFLLVVLGSLSIDYDQHVYNKVPTKEKTYPRT